MGSDPIHMGSAPRSLRRSHRTIDGLRLAYVDHGPADAERTLVWLHAFPFSADMWAPQLDAAPPRWRLIAPDLRGFGDSAGDTGDRAAAAIEDYARDVIGLLQALQIRAPILGGLSLGGYVVFAVLRALRALDRPACQPAGLVLADTRPQADTEEGRAARARMIALVEREGAEGLLPDMLVKLVAATTYRQRADVVDELRGWIRAARPAAVAGALQRMMTRPDSSPELAGIDVPTLILVGEHDSLTPPEQSRGMQAAIPGADLAILADAGHMSNVEQPRAFNDALRRFLDRL